MTEKLDSYKRAVAAVAMLVVVFISFLIVRPFLVSILTAAALAYIFNPVYKYFLKSPFPLLGGKKTSSAMLTCALIILIVLIPAAFMTSILTYEIRNGYVFLQDFLSNPNWSLPNLPSLLPGNIISPEQVRVTIGELISQVLGWLQNVLKGIPNVMLNIFITIFSTYYFLKHGRDIYAFFKDLFPLPKERYAQILSRFDDLSRGMILGQIVVGGIQGVLAWMGFLVLGVPNPVLWGFLTALISMIPLLGAAIVWVPIFVYLAITSYYTGIYWPPIAMLLWGTFVVSTIDNILKPKIVGESAKIHPLVILFGILGGIQLFGIAGLLLGPLVLTIFDVVIVTYRETL
jgi:predicted PurR-regulated permease PerM